VSIQFIGLPVFLPGALSPVGAVGGWLASRGAEPELLVVCSGRSSAPARRLPGSKVLSAGRAGVWLDVEPAEFRRAPVYFGDPAQGPALPQA
jgi:hypothetical protein